MTGPDLGKTALDQPAAEPSGAGVPVLLVVGTAQHGGTPPPTRVITIGDGGLTIGRLPAGSSGAGVTGTWLVPDRLVSERHAILLREGDRVTISDLGSTNGTLVDQRRITAPTVLRNGALICTGAHAAVFRWASEAELTAVADEQRAPLGPVATSSPTLATVCARLRKLSPSRTELLLIGETGTGKEIYARAVHACSGRPGNMVAINCAAIPRELLESELFGYSRGAHSTAHRTKPGLLNQADGGTILLDEIGDMPHELQAKLLRFLETREVMPLGATQAQKLDVRIIAATARGGEGRLREDLLARLGAEPIVLPPLRERVEDMGALMRHFMTEPRPPLSTRAFGALLAYRWPRNVRELQKVVETAQLLAAGNERIDVQHLPAALLEPAAIQHPAAPASDSTPAPAAASEAPARRPAPDREQLAALLEQHQGSVAEVARTLGRRWQVVWRWMKGYGLNADDYRPGR